MYRPLLENDTAAVLPGPPGRPDVIHIEGTSVSLEWPPSEHGGGAGITGYVVKIMSGLDADQYDTKRVDEVTTSCTISGQLRQQTLYKFAVTAATDAGQGPWSEWSDEVQTNKGCYCLEFSFPQPV